MTTNDRSAPFETTLDETRALIQDDVLRGQLDDAVDLIGSLKETLPRVREVAAMLIAALRAGHRLYMIGNGGSALEAQHFAAELVGHYRTDHLPLAAISLTADGGNLTAIANDYDFGNVFSRQIEAFGAPGDVLVVFSTSGNSRNLLAALETAHRIGMTRLALAGNGGGQMRDRCEYDLFIPATDTARIQEAHLVFVHLLSEYLDRAFARS